MVLVPILAGGVVRCEGSGALDQLLTVKSAGGLWIGTYWSNGSNWVVGSCDPFRLQSSYCQTIQRNGEKEGEKNTAGVSLVV